MPMLTPTDLVAEIRFLGINTDGDDLSTSSVDQIDVDLRGVEQLVEISQVRTIANIFIYIHQHDLCNGTLTLSNKKTVSPVPIKDGVVLLFSPPRI